MIQFYDTYRSYIVNYGLGEKLVREAVENAGEDSDARWHRFEEIISGSTLPQELR